MSRELKCGLSLEAAIQPENLGECAIQTVRFI